jgi:ankyrin repeat protein
LIIAAKKNLGNIVKLIIGKDKSTIDQVDHQNKTALMIAEEKEYREIVNIINAQECSICFELMIANDPVAVIVCNHKFHAHCIDKWLTTPNTEGNLNTQCPLCRAQLIIQ